MAAGVPVETAEHELRGLVDRLRLGESVTLLDPRGQPVALLVSLKRAEPTRAGGAPAWEAWKAESDALSERITRSWKSEKSAVEIISEMRR